MSFANLILVPSLRGISSLVVSFFPFSVVPNLERSRNQILGFASFSESGATRSSACCLEIVLSFSVASQSQKKKRKKKRLPKVSLLRLAQGEGEGIEPFLPNEYVLGTLNHNSEAYERKEKTIHRSMNPNKEEYPTTNRNLLVLVVLQQLPMSKPCFKCG